MVDFKSYSYSRILSFDRNNDGRPGIMNKKIIIIIIHIISIIYYFIIITYYYIILLLYILIISLYIIILIYNYCTIIKILLFITTTI